MANVKVKIKKGDKVVMLKGKDRGKSGKVLKVTPSQGRVVVEGLNVVKKTIRPRRQGEKGQIVSVPASVRIENAQLMCPSCNKAARVGFRIRRDQRERYCKKCQSKI